MFASGIQSKGYGVTGIEVKGWRQGLLIVVPPQGIWTEIIEAVHEKLDEARARSFWRGSQTTFDCGERLVDAEELKALTDRVRRGFGLIPAAVVTTQAETQAAAQAMGLEVFAELPAFKKTARDKDEDSTEEKPAEKPTEKTPERTESATTAQVDYAPTNALYLSGTVRSGQRIVHDTHLVICGDVNAGGEVMAGGDILVLGTLRGLAHAGCFGNESARIVATILRPHQLRIATKIARAPEDSERPERSGRGEHLRPEVARIESGEIGVFPL